jgi:hypothetical protein
MNEGNKENISIPGIMLNAKKWKATSKKRERNFGFASVNGIWPN